jgi:flotillin
MLGYRVPDPDEAMLIAGGRARGADAAPFRVIVGQGAFVLPMFRRASFLGLTMREAEVTEQCITQQGITLQVKAVIAFKVGQDEQSIVNAAQRFLSDESQMEVLTGRIFAGHLRSIVGSMRVEDIIRERQKLASEILEGSQEEMAKLGLIVDTLQIQSIDDMGVGYIQALAAPHQANVQREAKVAEAKANEESAEAEQDSARKQAEFRRTTQVTEAGYKAEVDAEVAKASQAGPLAEAEAKKAVIDAEADLAKRNALLREQQLEAEVVKPAEAEAKRTVTAANAEAEATEAQARAANSEDRVSLDRMMIEQLPSIVEKAAAGLAHANVSVLNGADGLADVAASLAAQGRAIFDAVRITQGQQQAWRRPDAPRYASDLTQRGANPTNAIKAPEEPKEATAS